MYLLITRTFPPELGGMQNLMWGLARSLAKLNLIKVFADFHENHEEFDSSVSFSIERVSGMKLIRKYRKSYLINDYLENNKKVECLIADHWKSLELIKTNKKILLISENKPEFKTNFIYRQEILESNFFGKSFTTCIIKDHIKGLYSIPLLFS